MKTRRARILSLLLSVCILLGLAPIAPYVSAATPGNVIYKRLSPEVAILNENTGKSSSFYQALVKNYGKDGCKYTEYYNGIGLFHGGNYKTTDFKTKIVDDKTGTDDGKLYFGGTEYGFEGSVLRTVSKKRNNLAANLSATLYNRVHSHNVSLFKARDVLAYETVYLCISGDYRSRLHGSTAGMAVKLSRFNEYDDFTDPYSSIYYTQAAHGGRAFLKFEKSAVTYDKGTCTCGGAYAENMLVTFRDDSAPKLAAVSYSTDGGSTWQSHNKKLYVGKGDKLRIRLTYDEPIRFADDSAAHDDLKLILSADGAAEGSSPEASLVELSENSLYFEYKMTGNEGLTKVSSASLSRLFRNDLPLKQVIKDSSFTLTESNMGDKTGFSITSAYITDLAGNPITERSYLTDIVLDTEAPYVSDVRFEGDTANSDVKEALGDKLDLSDTHLGEGDSLRITVELNEEITLTQKGVQKWEHATIVTNLLLTDGIVNNRLGDRAAAGLGVKVVGGKSYLTVQSSYLYAYDGKTVLYGGTIPIHSNMQAENSLGYENGEGMIYVTAVEFDEAYDIEDFAGNAYGGKIADNANSSAYYLDVTPPTVTSGGTIKEGEDGFRLSINIEDNGTAASGMQGIFGTFALRNGGDSTVYEYEYVLNASAEEPTDGWKAVRFNDPIRFVQVASGNYLHVRPKSGTAYGDVSNCTVTVRAKDLAGNLFETDLTVNDSEYAWSLDGIAPSAYIKGTSRRLSGGKGTLSVTVALSDKGGLSEAFYSVDGKNTWNALSLTEGATEAEDTASITVAADEKFEEEFFVRVVDLSGNVAELSLGKVSYDLSKAKYSIDYPTDFTDGAQLFIRDLAEEDELVFLVELPESAVGKTDRYAAFAATTADGLSSDENLFSRTTTINGNAWYLVSFERTVTEDGSIRYVFDGDEEYRFWDSTNSRPAGVTSTSVPASLHDFWYSLSSKSFTGNLNVTVLAGKRGAFTRFPNAAGVSNETQRSVMTAGNDTQAISEARFTLKVCGYSLTPYAPSFVPENGAALSVSHTNPYFYPKSSAFQLSTLKDQKFIVTIPNDEYGWNFGALDYTRSYIKFENKAVTPFVSYEVPLEPIVPDADDPTRSTQIVTVPNLDFASGIYQATLFLAARAGTNYTVWLKDENGDLFPEITVDTTEPSDDFYLSSLTFTPDEHYLNLYDGLNLYGYDTREITAENGVYHLPIYRNLSDNHSSTHTLSFKTEGEKATALTSTYQKNYIGQFALEIRNTDASLSSNALQISSSSEDFSDISLKETRYIKRIAVINDASEAANSDYLYLYAGKVNTVSVQKVYANGKRSAIKTYSILPDDSFLSGEAQTAAENGGQLVFTPDEGLDLAGAKFYAYIFTAGKTSSDANLYPQKTVDMEPYPDGTWRCALAEDGANYTVVGITKYGSVSIASNNYVRANAPWFDEDGVSVTDSGDGTYSISFTLRDDRYDLKNTPPEITLTFDEAYASLLGTDSFTFTPVYGYDGSYTWKADAESPTGIYEITAVRGEGELSHNIFYQYDTLSVTVNAVCANDGSNTAMPLSVTVSATDRLGLSAEDTASGTVSGKLPSVSFTYGRNVLTARFSQPVRPVSSWAWQEKDAPSGTYLSKEWVNAFPIAGNGTHTIEYRDLFGTVRTTEVELTDTFIVNGIDYSIDLSFSTTAQTNDSVIVNAASHDGGQLIVWKRGDGNIYTTVAPIGGLPGLSTEKRSTEFFTNTEIAVVRYDKQYSGNYQGPWQGVSTRVYITNIAHEAPAATLLYYLESLGREFTVGELSDYIARYGENGTLDSDGAVTVRYYTDRFVTPTGNSGTEFTFRKGSERTHTFTYADDFGNEGSVTASLPAGLNLTDSPAPWVDTGAPIVTAGIYAKRFGSYSSAESFLADEEESVIFDRFIRVGAAQGFLLRLDIRDESTYTISLSETDGASLTGNIITIAKPCDFTVTVEDAAGNRSAFAVNAAMLGAIDTISPAAQTEVVSTGLYSKDGYIRPYDVDENGNEISGAGHAVTLTDPQNVTKELRDDGKEWYKLSFTDNGSVAFTFCDEVGNYGNATLTVSGIDTSSPTLSIRWSPSYTYEKDGVLCYDDAHPTQGTTGGTITAHVSSDVPLSAVYLESDGFYPTFLSEDGTTVPLGDDTGITARYSPERITINYEQNYAHAITFAAVGPNGRESSITLPAINDRIDREAPTVSETRTPLLKSGSNAPFGYTLTLTPNEPAYSQNYGKLSASGEPTYYDSENPLSLTVIRDGSFTVLFSDKAGNITRHEVSVTGIDRDAPTLTLRYPEDNPNLLRPTSDPVSLYVTADEDCTLTVGENTYALTKKVEKELSFTENGTFILRAVDKAGNESECTVTIHCIDRGLPSLRFDTNFVYLAEGADASELTALLEKGYTAWDNVVADGYPIVRFDETSVDLNAAGSYEVLYTATDAAGNVLETTRFVNVVGKNTLCVYVNGKLILPEGTAVIRKGENTLAVQNLQNILPGEYEPHTVKIRKGIFSLGQMKRLSGGKVAVEPDGSFTVTESGFYTVLVTTQSKRTVRITLYLEK